MAAPAHRMDAPTFIKDYGPSVAWIVAAVGWMISNHHANRREKRKEFRSEIDAIEKTVKSVSEKLAAYYRLPVNDPSLTTSELEIKILFKEIDLKWERLSKRSFWWWCSAIKSECGTSNERFYDHATGAYFESIARLPAADIGHHVHKLNFRALRFIENLHSLFLCEFDGIKPAK